MCFKSVSATLEAQTRMSVALPWDSWIPLCSQHLGAPTLLPCLPPHRKEDEKQHHGAVEEGFFGGMSCIQLGGHVRGSTLLIASAAGKKHVCKHLMTPLISWVLHCGCCPGCSAVSAPPWMLHRGCSDMGAPPWVLHCGCSNMDAPPWVLCSECSTMDAPP